MHLRTCGASRSIGELKDLASGRFDRPPVWILQPPEGDAVPFDVAPPRTVEDLAGWLGDSIGEEAAAAVTDYLQPGPNPEGIIIPTRHSG